MVVKISRTKLYLEGENCNAPIFEGPFRKKIKFEWSKIIMEE